MGRLRVLAGLIVVVLLAGGSPAGVGAASSGGGSNAPRPATAHVAGGSRIHAAALVSPTGLKRTARKAVTHTYTLRWQVVHILGLAGGPTAAIDGAVKADVDQMILAFKRDVAAGPPLAGEPRYTFDETATLVRSVPGMVGLRVDSDWFLGGAHPIPDVDAFNAIAATGQRVRIGEVIRTASFPDLAEAARQALQAQLPSDEWDFIGMGTEPTASNYNAWFATPAGLRFVFQPYQVAPYSAGEPEITLPWSQVQPWIRPKAPAPIRIAAGL